MMLKKKFWDKIVYIGLFVFCVKSVVVAKVLFLGMKNRSFVTALSRCVYNLIIFWTKLLLFSFSIICMM